MAKNKISEFSSTAANNTDIGNINIAEGCAPSGINNAIRELMAQLKDQQTGVDGDNFTVGGGFTCTGAAVFSSTVAVSGASTFIGNASFTNNVSANGNVTLGNGSVDAHVLNGTLTAATSGKILLDDSVTTATAPALAFDGDTNTGIYRPAADTLAIATNGAERVSISNSGLTVNNALTCTGAAVFSSTVAISGAAVFSSTVAISGAATAPTPSVTDDTTKVATTAFVRDIVPTGVIVMWSGSIASIPSGWLLCDGTNSTPDLRNRFIVGAGSTYSVDGTGGSADAIVVSHTHTATVTDPGHFHNGPTADEFKSYGDSGIVSNGPSGLRTTDTIGTTQTKTTGITVSNSTTGSSGTNANLPPYYALAYIMKS
jgi:hypothetical protein